MMNHDNTLYSMSAEKKLDVWSPLFIIYKASQLEVNANMKSKLYSPLIEGRQATGKARSQRFTLIIMVEGKQAR